MSERSHLPGQTSDRQSQTAVDEESDRTRQLALRRRQIQRKASGRESGAGGKIPQAGGAPLGGDVQKRMEGSLGADLSAARIHTGAESAQAARDLGAEAFTDGNDIHFAEGRHAPGTKEGDRLLAHELTHVAQGSGGQIMRSPDPGGATDKTPGVSQPSDPAEQQADKTADAVADQQHPADGATPGAQASADGGAPTAQITQLFAGLESEHAAAKQAGPGEQGAVGPAGATQPAADAASQPAADAASQPASQPAADAASQPASQPAAGGNADFKVPEALQQKAHEILTLMAGLDDATFQSIVDTKITPAQTQAFLMCVSHADKAAQAALLTKFKGERTVGAALDMKDKLYWAGPSGPGADGKIKTETDRPKDDKSGSEHNTNDFAKWVRGEGPEPTDTSKMNCWEAVMFSAFKAGVIPKDWIVGVHRDAAADDYFLVLQTALGYSSAKEMTDKVEPGRGDVVFFDGLAHVALSLGSKTATGEHEVMSLWILPGGAGGNFNSAFQKTTIEAVNGGWVGATGKSKMKIMFNKAPW